MTADTLGGVWIYASELIGALAEHDVRVTLATMGAPMSPGQKRAMSRLRGLNVLESTYALEWMPLAWPDVDAAGDWLLHIAQRVRPDLVHVNGFAHAALPFGVPVVCAAHSCVFTWHRAVKGRDPGPEWNEYRRRAHEGITRAAVVVAPTIALLRDVFAAYEVTGADGRVIPNGRALPSARNVEKQPLVFAAGRVWDEAKGLATLAACAPHVPWPISVAGPTRPPPGIAAPPPPSNVHLLGELTPDEVAGWMARASVYALPARYEPFGLSVLEAAISGCALILGDIPSLRELWEGAATFVPPGDADSLAHAISAMTQDPLRLGAWGASARARSRGMTPTRMGAAYGALYAELCAQPGGAVTA
ncbi:MAG: glycosyltransferase family 4 protein [Deltaproteobacteria bacterium]|nr:glycosyltransferase family 4 protein [Deltaproteobacteria bacterium]